MNEIGIRYWFQYRVKDDVRPVKNYRIILNEKLCDQKVDGYAHTSSSFVFTITSKLFSFFTISRKFRNTFYFLTKNRAIRALSREMIHFCDVETTTDKQYYRGINNAVR